MLFAKIGMHLLVNKLVPRKKPIWSNEWKITKKTTEKTKMTVLISADYHANEWVTQKDIWPHYQDRDDLMASKLPASALK